MNTLDSTQIEFLRQTIQLALVQGDAHVLMRPELLLSLLASYEEQADEIKELEQEISELENELEDHVG